MDPVFIEVIKKIAENPESGIWALVAFFFIRELFRWLRSRNGKAPTTRGGQEQMITELGKINTNLQTTALSTAATKVLIEQIHRKVVG